MSHDLNNHMISMLLNVCIGVCCSAGNVFGDLVVDGECGDFLSDHAMITDL